MINQQVKASTATIALPTNEDSSKQLTTGNYDVEYVYAVNEPCVNLWYEKRKCYMAHGYFWKMVTTNTYDVEQLLCIDENSDQLWIHPPVIHVINEEKVVLLTNGKRYLQYLQ